MIALAEYQHRCGAVVVGGVVWRRTSSVHREKYQHERLTVYRWKTTGVMWWAYPYNDPHPTRDAAMLAALRAAGVRR